MLPAMPAAPELIADRGHDADDSCRLLLLRRTVAVLGIRGAA